MKEESIKISIEDENMTDKVEINENLENKNLEYLGEGEDMDLFLILDRSGSMYGSVSDTINGYNAFIEKQLVKNHNIKVTAILFDDEYEVLYSKKPIDEVKPLTEREYYVRGCTALLDAVGKTVNTYKREVKKGMCVIISDGYENASREFTKSQIKDMVENTGWEFIFIGADIDSYGESSKIGIRRNRTANFSKTTEGINEMFKSVDIAVNHCYNGESFDEDWKENLE